MVRAAFITLLLVLALPAAAGDTVGGAIRDAVDKKLEERKTAKENDSEKKELPVTAKVGHRTSFDLLGDQDSMRIATCPMGAAGAPTFEQVRTYFRNYTDNEMWKICLNRSSYMGAFSGGCACALLAYPDPWRPVDTPHTLERDSAPKTVPEESANNGS